MAKYKVLFNPGFNSAVLFCITRLLYYYSLIRRKILLKLLALTGGIGCGKSTVSRIFYEVCHWQIIDADKICHELYEQNNAELTEPLISRWGTVILDQNQKINRQEIGKIVFGNPEELDFLNRVLHPMIFDEVKRRKTKAEENHCTVAVLDAPLLYECAWEHCAETVVAVWAPAEIQYRRLRERGWNHEQIQKRLAAQMSAEQKMKQADYAIINNGSLDWLQRQIKILAGNLEPEKQ